MLPVDAPEMTIVAFTGPLAGTGAPSTDGLIVLSKSPLTGTVGESLLKEPFGGALKKAGFDGVVISGRGTAPMGIEITDNDISFVDAGHPHGLDVRASSAKLDNDAAIVIGPAGERQVPLAGLAATGDDALEQGGLERSPA